MIRVNLLSDLSERVKTAVLDKLRAKPAEFFYHPHSPLKESIGKLYAEKVIDDGTLDAALREASLKQARADFRYLMRKNISFPYVDNNSMPELLAYGIQNGIFSDNELKRMPFDHGMTLESFCKDYGELDLIKSLKYELLNPKPLPKFDERNDPHPACC